MAAAEQPPGSTDGAAEVQPHGHGALCSVLLPIQTDAAPHGQQASPVHRQSADASREHALSLRELVLGFWAEVQTMPLWPSECVLEPAKIEAAMQSEAAQVFLASASRLGVSQQSARELLVVSGERPTLFYLCALANLLSVTLLSSVIFGVYWHLLGGSILQVTPSFLVLALGLSHWACMMRWGPATLAWSALGVGLLSSLIMCGNYIFLAALFVPTEQIVFGDRFARVVLFACLCIAANNWCYIAVPQCPPTRSWVAVMGVTNVLNVVRYVDNLTDLEVSDTLFKQAASEECVWLGGTQRCDVYTALAVANLLAGIFDFSIANVVVLFDRFNDVHTKVGYRLHMGIHVTSLVLQLSMLSVNAVYTFAIEPLRPQSSGSGIGGFASPRATLAFFFLSFFLTGASAVINIIGIATVWRFVQVPLATAVTRASNRIAPSQVRFGSVLRFGSALFSQPEVQPAVPPPAKELRALGANSTSAVRRLSQVPM